MHADELRKAVSRVVEILKRSDIRGALDKYRAARGDDRAVAAARLGHAGAMIMERMEGFSAIERRVARLMHLELLGSPDYWQSLLGGAADPKTHQAEIVRLASRVMFASGQLPVLISLLESVETAPAGANAAPTENVPDHLRRPLASGESRLVVRLSDAGEKASDPDRIARSVDGIDMLYSACASIARKPAMELRLDAMDGTVHRDLHFTGERDSLSAVVAVIESIPAALAAADDDGGDIDLEAVIASLPVFADLDTLGALGTFEPSEMKDIGDTMHQGALLVLESGVVLVPQAAAASAASAGGRVRGANGAATGAPAGVPAEARGSDAARAPDLDRPDPDRPDTDRPDTDRTSTSGRAASEGGDGAPAGGALSAKAVGDEHYEHYLREREAMRNPPPVNGAGDTRNQRREAVEELLRSLDQARNGS